MKMVRRAQLLSISALLITAVGGMISLSGCKNSTSNAAVAEHAVGPPPTFDIFQTHANPLTANPLDDPIWLNAGWHTFVAPINSTRTTPAARAAMLYDATTLYVAFVSEKSDRAVSRDVVSVYLDPTLQGDGREVAQISVDAAGTASCTWIRLANIPTKHEDGTPDLSYPAQKIPDQRVPGLQAHLGQATINGIDEWTAVVAIPLKQLPKPLKTVASPGGKWKLNLLRTMVATSGGSTPDVFQSNLSPVHVNAQPVSPERMAEVHLSNQDVSAGAGQVGITAKN